MFKFNIFRKKETIQDEDRVSKTYNNKLEELKRINNSLKDELEEIKNNYNNTHDYVDDYIGIFESESLLRIGKMDEVISLLKSEQCVNIVFRFNWKSYASIICIIGEKSKREIVINTPRIPLLGAIWSNRVATRMITGQVFVSSMLECIYTQVKYLAQSAGLKTRIVKVDKCFYAPYMYYMYKSDGTLADDLSEEGSYKRYSALLVVGNPEAYDAVMSLKDGKNYWTEYYDKL